MKDKHNQITLPNTVSKRLVNCEERRRIAHRRYRFFPLRTGSDRNQITLPNTDSRRLVNCEERRQC
ncbi:hypothetical protein [Nostoc sp.]|uniref:hypothetical protein n=1 Tax=Nostoc sp. TaxID=1180 RepID=UPI002FF7074C